MAAPLEISVQATPNPHAAKFTLNRVVAAHGTTYRRMPSVTTEASPAQPAWIVQVLEIAGVTQVFALNDFISITKTPEADWNVITPRIEQILRQAFQ